jgi:hypothetical protein
MLVRLSRTKRLRAGWFVALVYLLCVLAPSISFALPGGHAVAPCLTDDNHVPGMVHVHNQRPAQHVHADGHPHDHSGAHSHASFDGENRSMKIAVNAKQVPEKAPHSSDGQCCGLTCVTALPATLIDIAKPSAPAAVCEAESYRKATDSAPAGLYRPPIS